MCKMCQLEGHQVTPADVTVRTKHSGARWLALDEDASTLIETRASQLNAKFVKAFGCSMREATTGLRSFRVSIWFSS